MEDKNMNFLLSLLLALQLNRKSKLLMPLLSFMWCLTGNVSSADSPWRPWQLGLVSLAGTCRLCWGGYWWIFEWLVLFICFWPSFLRDSLKLCLVTWISNEELIYNEKSFRTEESFSAFPWGKRKQSTHLWLRTYMWNLACKNVPVLSYRCFKTAYWLEFSI